MLVTAKLLQDIPNGEVVHSLVRSWSGPYNRFGYVRHVGLLRLIEDAHSGKITDLSGFSDEPIFTWNLAADDKTRQKS